MKLSIAECVWRPGEISAECAVRLAAPGPGLVRGFSAVTESSTRVLSGAPSRAEKEYDSILPQRRS